MTSPGVNPLLALPPPTSDIVGGSVYGDMLAAFFSTYTEAKRQQIWVNFLEQNNLTDPPPVNVDTQKLFLNYVQGVFDSLHNTIISLHEVKKRNIMFSVFNELIDMLLAIQNCVSVETQTLAFYARWQQQYTRMLARVPTYVGGESSAVNVDLNDLSKFTFGYANISVADMAAWYANNHVSGNPNETFSIQAMYPFGYNFNSADPPGNVSPNPFGSWNGGAEGTGYDSKLTFSITNGAFTITLQTPVAVPPGTPNSIQPTDDDAFLIDADGKLVYTAPQLIFSTAIPPGTDFKSYVDNFQGAFLNFWNGGGSSLINSLSNTFNIHANDDQGAFSNVFNDFINNPDADNRNSPVPQNDKADNGDLDRLDKLGLPLSIQASQVLNQIFRRTNYNTDPWAFFEIPKPYTYVASANNTESSNKSRNLGDSNAKYRAEINSRNQQYIENIRSNRQVVQDASSQIQANLDTTRQSVAQQADLITSIIDSLKGLIASIFR